MLPTFSRFSHLRHNFFGKYDDDAHSVVNVRLLAALIPSNELLLLDRLKELVLACLRAGQSQLFLRFGNASFCPLSQNCKFLHSKSVLG